MEALFQLAHEVLICSGGFIADRGRPHATPVDYDGDEPLLVEALLLMRQPKIVYLFHQSSQALVDVFTAELLRCSILVFGCSDGT
jgi:hypothetical protein